MATTPPPLPSGYSLDDPPPLPAGYSLDAAAPANVLDDPRNRFVGTSNGIPVYAAQSSPITKAAGAWWEGIGGKALFDIMGGASRDPERAQKALETVKALITGFAGEPGRVWSELGATGQAMVQANLPSVAYHLAGAVPLFGAGAQQVAKDIEQGGYAEALGHTAALATPFLRNAVGPELETAAAAVRARLPESVPVLPRIVSPTNPKIQGALDYLESKGAQIPLAARTDNPFIRNTQKGLEATPLGAITAAKSNAANTAVLQSEAANLIGRATPETPADVHYSVFRNAAADPANIEPVTVGKALSPEAKAALDSAALRNYGQGYNSLDYAQKNVIREGVQDTGVDLTPKPVTEQVAMPADVTGIKKALKPIFDEITQWWEPAKRNASAGYTAMKSILEGPDVVPATVAESGLSGLKALAREGDPRSAGIAKKIIPTLQDLVDNAAAKAGPDVVDAIKSGRKAAAAEMAVDQLNKIFEKGQATGGMSREAGMWQDWLRMRGDIARQLPAPLVSDLEKFFLGAKRLAENPNPSGSATTAISTAMLTHAAYHPATGVPALLGTGMLAKLLRSRAGVQALTRGLDIPLGTPAAESVVRQIADIVGPEAATAAGAAASPTMPPGDLPADLGRMNPAEGEQIFQEQKGRIQPGGRRASQ